MDRTHELKLFISKRYLPNSPGYVLPCSANRMHKRQCLACGTAKPSDTPNLNHKRADGLDHEVLNHHMMLKIVTFVMDLKGLISMASVLL